MLSSIHIGKVMTPEPLDCSTAQLYRTRLGDVGQSSRDTWSLSPCDPTKQSKAHPTTVVGRLHLGFPGSWSPHVCLGVGVKTGPCYDVVCGSFALVGPFLHRKKENLHFTMVFV